MAKKQSTASRRSGPRFMYEKKADVQQRTVRFLNGLGPYLLEISRSLELGERQKIVAYLHAVRANVTEALNDLNREVRS